MSRGKRSLRSKRNRSRRTRKYRSRKNRSLKFATIARHYQGAQVYDASTQFPGGILMANNAFSWQGNPLDRALMAAHG